MVWHSFTFASSRAGSGVSAVARKADTMEVWSITKDGAVLDSYFYEDAGWKSFQLAAPGSAAQGGISSVSRNPSTMEVFWISPEGAVHDATWHGDRNPAWSHTQLPAAGQAAAGAITSLSRKPEHMEVFWITTAGAVHDAYFYEAVGWKDFELASPGSAAPGSITCVSRVQNAMEVWWIGRNGSIQAAVDSDPDSGKPWVRIEIFGPGSAVPGALASVSREPLAKDLFWITPSGAVQSGWAYNEGKWNQFQLAQPGSVVVSGGIAITSFAAEARNANTEEVWWVGKGGEIQDAYWYTNAGWKMFKLVPSGVAAKGGIAATSRTSRSLEIFYGKADNSLGDSWIFLTPPKCTVWFRDLVQVWREEHGGDSVAGTVSVFVKHIDRHLEVHTFPFPAAGTYKLENDGPRGGTAHVDLLLYEGAADEISLVTNLVEFDPDDGGAVQILGDVDKAAEGAVSLAIKTAATATPGIGPLVGFAADALIKIIAGNIHDWLFGKNDVYPTGNLILYENQPGFKEVTVTQTDDGGDHGKYTFRFELQVAQSST